MRDIRVCHVPFRTIEQRAKNWECGRPISETHKKCMDFCFAHDKFEHGPDGPPGPSSYKLYSEFLKLNKNGN